jgi:hypothetical protein
MREMATQEPVLDSATKSFWRAVKNLYPTAKLKMAKGYSTNFVQVYPYVDLDVYPEGGRPFFNIKANYDTYRKYSYGNDVGFGSFLNYTVEVRLGGVATGETFRDKNAKAATFKAIAWLKGKSEADADNLMRTIGVDPHLRPNAAKPTLDEIKALVKRESWFTLDESSVNSVEYSTRDHGDVGQEMPGIEDVRMANKVAKILLDKFGSNNLTVRVERVDEWVHLTVTIK